MESVFQYFFEQYEILVEQVDHLVNKVDQQFPDCVACKSGCYDCCHAVFDLTFIEALYLNSRFKKIIPSKKKKPIMEVSNEIDRKIHKLKRKAQNSLKDGEKSSEQLLYEMATFKIKCPLLNSNNLCEMYEFRPITCRVYGVPTSFAGQGHTCGLSDFETGKSYPTINLDAIHKKLYVLSENLLKKLQSKHIRIAEILMPVSMALLTEFNNKYLGVKDN